MYRVYSMERMLERLRTREWYCFQSPCIGSIQWNCQSLIIEQIPKSSFSPHVSGLFNGTYNINGRRDNNASAFSPHVSGLFNGTRNQCCRQGTCQSLSVPMYRVYSMELNRTGHLDVDEGSFQSPCIGSIQWNTSHYKKKRKGRPLSVPMYRVYSMERGELK